MASARAAAWRASRAGGANCSGHGARGHFWSLATCAPGRRCPRHFAPPALQQHEHHRTQQHLLPHHPALPFQSPALRPPPCSLPLALRSEVERRSHGDFALRPAGSNGTAAHAPNGRPAADVPSWSLMAPCHCASDACPFRRPLCEWPLPDRTDRIGETEDEPDKQRPDSTKSRNQVLPSVNRQSRGSIESGTNSRSPVPRPDSDKSVFCEVRGGASCSPRPDAPRRYRR